MKFLYQLGLSLFASLLPGIAMAAEFDGARLNLLWAIPFAGILLSIALMPLMVPSFWHHHFRSEERRVGKEC